MTTIEQWMTISVPPMLQAVLRSMRPRSVAAHVQRPSPAAAARRAAGQRVRPCRGPARHADPRTRGWSASRLPRIASPPRSAPLDAAGLGHLQSVRRTATAVKHHRRAGHHILRSLRPSSLQLPWHTSRELRQFRRSALGRRLTARAVSSAAMALCRDASQCVDRLAVQGEALQPARFTPAQCSVWRRHTVRRPCPQATCSSQHRGEASRSTLCAVCTGFARRWGRPRHSATSHVTTNVQSLITGQQSSTHVLQIASLLAAKEVLARDPNAIEAAVTRREVWLHPSSRCSRVIGHVAPDARREVAVGGTVDGGGERAAAGWAAAVGPRLPQARAGPPAPHADPSPVRRPCMSSGRLNTTATTCAPIPLCFLQPSSHFARQRKHFYCSRLSSAWRASRRCSSVGCVWCTAEYSAS